MSRAILLAGLAAAALQAGCGATPQSLGITGPGTSPPVQPQAAPDDGTSAPPGVPDPNTSSGIDQRFYRYN
jgi:hypothetical protein